MLLFGAKSKLISTFIFFVAIFFYLALLWTYQEKIPAITFNTLSVSVLALSTLLSTVMISLGGVIWLSLLRYHKVTIAPVSIIGILMISQLGKYLPGNIGQHVGRVLLAQRAGISTPIILSTMIIETMWIVANGCGLALLSIYLFVDVSNSNVSLIPGKIELLLASVLLIALPWIGIYLVNTYFPSLTKWLTKADVIPLPKVSTAIIVSALCVTSFTIMGLILKIQAQWLFGTIESNILELTCLFAIAWLAGYVVPGAPAGLGVREAMMVLLLSPVLGAGTAVVLSVTLRVTTTLGDLLAFALGMLIRKYVP